MNSTLRNRTAAVILLLVAGGFAACSSGGGTTGEATSGTPASASASDNGAPVDGSEAVEGDEAETHAGDPVAGKVVFEGTCATCHGPDATGIEGLGKNLHDNQFVQSKTDEEMIAFIKTGRPATDPLNTTGVDMPPKGGNPALNDDDLANVLAFVRTLQ
jgi:disulfide bond formation protein DsbB